MRGTQHPLAVVSFAHFLSGRDVVFPPSLSPRLLLVAGVGPPLPFALLALKLGPPSCCGVDVVVFLLVVDVFVRPANRTCSKVPVQSNAATRTQNNHAVAQALLTVSTDALVLLGCYLFSSHTA